jgi:hypothetical protein
MASKRSLRRLADSIAKPGPPQPIVRFKVGTIAAYTPAAAFASVTIGADTIDAPFLAPYAPVAGDLVWVLLSGGQSPFILGKPGP